MSSVFEGLQPVGFWRIFELICSIPHPSGHESRLAQVLAELAEQEGLTARFDKAGNLRIDRPASLGLEKQPRVIIHGHLDMVPTSRPAGIFDFVNTSVTPVVDGEYVRADNTTLGADDGSGIAEAVSLLLDKELVSGPLSGVFTVGEEVGLLGAQAMDPNMLEGDYLLSMDRGDEDHFCIGCAGGARQEFTWQLPWENSPAGVGVKIKLSGLPGGHSGGCIHRKFGNSLLLLAEFATEHPELRISGFSGGGADNAIPTEAELTGVLAVGDIISLQNSAQKFVATTGKDLENSSNYRLEVVEVDKPLRVWQEAFTQSWLKSVVTVPNGPIKLMDFYDIVHTSSNFAAVKILDNILKVITSQRSLSDSDREKISGDLARHFGAIGAQSQILSCYPGWEPQPISAFVELAKKVRSECDFPNPVRVEPIHCGLEVGIFSKLNPDLKILSCGVTDIGGHTADEKMLIASVKRMDDFIRKLLKNLT